MFTSEKVLIWIKTREMLWFAEVFPSKSAVQLELYVRNGPLLFGKRKQVANITEHDHIICYEYAWVFVHVIKP